MTSTTSNSRVSFKQARKQFGNALRVLRQQKGLTQMQVAKQLNLTSAQYVSNFERGVTLPPVRKLGILSKTYKIPLIGLLHDYTTAITAKIQEQVKR